MDIKSLLKNARDAIKAKDFNNALIHSKAILKEDRDNYMGLIFLGKSCQETGNLDQALLAFKKATKLNDSNILGWNGLVSYFEKYPKNEFNDDLVKVYSKIIELESNEEKIKDIIKKIGNVKVRDPKLVVSPLLSFTKRDGVGHLKQEAEDNLINYIRTLGHIPNDLYEPYEEVLLSVISSPRTSKDCYLEYVKLLYIKKDYKALISESEKLYNFCNEPDSLELMYKAFNKLYIEENDNYKIFIENIKKYINLLVDSESFEGLLSKSIILCEEGDLFGMKKCLDNVSGSDSKNACYQMLLIKCKICLRLYDEVFERIQNLKKGLNGKQQENISEILNIYECEAFAKCSEKNFYDKAIKLCTKILNHSSSIKVTGLLIESYICTGNYVEANTWLSKIRESDENLYYLNKAKLAKAKGMLEDALKILENHIIESSEYYLLLGDLYWELKYFNKALLPYIKAAKCESNYYQCFLKLGNYYKHVKDFEKARKCYEKCFTMNPNCSLAGIEIMNIYRLQGKWEEKLDLLLSITKSKINRSNKWAYFQLGMHYMDVEDYRSSVESLRYVISTDTENSFYWEALADAYLGRGSYTSALKSYEQVLELKPESLYSKLQVANIKKILGEYKEALVSFTDVLLHDVSYLPAIKGIGETYLYQGRQYFSQQLYGLARDNAQNAINIIISSIKQFSNLSCLWKIIADSTYLITHLPANYQCLMVEKEYSEDGSGFLDSEQLFSFAEKCYCLAIHNIKENVLIYHDLATCYLSHAKILTDSGEKEKLFEKALTVAKFCTSTNSTHWHHWNLLGNVAFFKDPQDITLAQHAFIKAVTIEHKSAVSWCNLGLLYLKLNYIKLANEAFSMAQRSDPNYLNSWIGQALIAEMAAHHEAMDLFRHSTQLGVHPESGLGYSYWVCRTLLESPPGKVLYSIHNMHAIPVACDSLTWYTEKNSTDSCAWNMLGILQERMGLHNVALKSFKNAYRFCQISNFDIASNNYARLLAKTGNISESIKVYQNLKEATFNSGIGLALAYFKDEQYEDSYETYGSALNWLTMEQEHQSDLLIALASMAYLSGDAENTKTLLLQSAKCEPRSPWSLYATLSLGLLHDDLDLATLALDELHESKDDNKCLSHYSLLLCYNYLLRGETKKALYESSKLVHRHPNHSSLWLNLSVLLLRIHEHKPITGAVTKCAQVAMKLGQTNSDISKVLSIISLAALKSGAVNLGLKLSQSAIHCYPDKTDNWSMFIYALQISKHKKVDINKYKKFTFKNNC